MDRTRCARERGTMALTSINVELYKLKQAKELAGE